MPVPFTLVKPSDSPWKVEPPIIRCEEGIFLYFGGGKISGVTAVVWWR
jgi:hypothetical protein